jgi:hypothetical protein
MVGHRRITTRSAFRWWCQQLTAMADGQAVVNDSDNDVASIARAEREADQLNL